MPNFSAQPTGFAADAASAYPQFDDQQAIAQQVAPAPPPDPTDPTNPAYDPQVHLSVLQQQRQQLQSALANAPVTLQDIDALHGGTVGDRNRAAAANTPRQVLGRQLDNLNQQIGGLQTVLQARQTAYQTGDMGMTYAQRQTLLPSDTLAKLGANANTIKKQGVESGQTSLDAAQAAARSGVGPSQMQDVFGVQPIAANGGMVPPPTKTAQPPLPNGAQPLRPTNPLDQFMVTPSSLGGTPNDEQSMISSEALSPGSATPGGPPAKTPPIQPGYNPSAPAAPSDNWNQYAKTPYVGPLKTGVPGAMQEYLNASPEQRQVLDKLMTSMHPQGANNPMNLMMAKESMQAIGELQKQKLDPMNRTPAIQQQLDDQISMHQNFIKSVMPATGMAPAQPSTAAPAAAAPLPFSIATAGAPSGGGAQPPSQAQPNADALRSDAQAAISKGASKEAVAARFKQMTGKDL